MKELIDALLQPQPSPVTHSLAEFLSRLNDEEIQARWLFLSNDDFALVKAAPSGERAEALTRCFTAPAMVRYNVLCLSEMALDFLSGVLEKPCVLTSDTLPKLYEAGIIHSLYLLFEEDGNRVLLVPDEISAAIKQHIPDFCAEAKAYRYFRDTIYAATCLYGVITHADAQFLLRYYNPAHVPNPDQTEEFLGLTQHYGGLWLVDDLIAHLYLEDFDTDALRGLIKAQQRYPRYLPGWDEFVASPEGDIPDEAPLFEAFEKYLVKTSPLPEETICAIAARFFDLIRLGYSADNVFDDLEKQKALPRSRKHQAELWFRLCNFCKKVRRWAFHGHTEEEVARFAENREVAQADPDRKGLFPLLANPLEEEDEDVVDPVEYMKVGRNEPCPCGSGKKYKKCCDSK